MAVKVVTTADAAVEVEFQGSGDPVVLLPSLGRSCADFALLSRSLCEGGFRCMGINPRQIGNSRGCLSGITLHDLARDVADVIVGLEAGPAHIVGHAFGNRVARCLATDRPDLVRRLILMAAGGRFPPEPEARDAMIRILTESLTPLERMTLMQSALFADSTNVQAWSDGWWPRVALAQIKAAKATSVEEWWAGGTAPMLVVQGLADRLAPPANGRALQDEFQHRTRLVELENAGHAMLPEQPVAIANIVLAYLSNSAV
jgi:pimeloyl-ACP methyl ester carboxylesterase